MIGTFTGAPALSQIASAPEVPFFVSGVEANGAVAGFASSKKYARPTFGLMSGTAIGSAPASVSTCRISMRACALMYGMFAALKNHGTSVSVSLTSIMPAVHGGLVFTVESTGELWL